MLIKNVSRMHWNSGEYKKMFILTTQIWELGESGSK
jgi:hypothetical protein